jgi:sorting nexin-8
VGVVPRLISLKNDLPDVGLALSLHAPNQKLRSQIVPTAKAWHIDKIVKAANEFVIQQNEKITSDNRKQHILIEYVLIANVNDGEQVAHELGALLQGKAMLLNVIPYNPTSVPYDYKPPTNEKAQRFVDIVRNDYNVHTLFRQKLGQDIASACGQLVIDNACNDKIQDIEDMGSAPVKRKIVKKRAKSVNKNGSNPEKRLSQGYIVALAVLALLLGLVVRKFLQ